MKTLRQLFGEKVRVLRKTKNWTQERLGEEAGLHNTYVGSVERGEVNLSLDNVEKLSKALGNEPAELFKFHSATVSVSARERILMELEGVLENRSGKTLERILRIVRDVLELE